MPLVDFYFDRKYSDKLHSPFVLFHDSEFELLTPIYGRFQKTMLLLQASSFQVPSSYRLSARAILMAGLGLLFCCHHHCCARVLVL